MKKCNNCKYDIDMVSAIECAEHKWHNESWDDMCCLCGVDAEAMLK